MPPSVPKPRGEQLSSRPVHPFDVKPMTSMIARGRSCFCGGKLKPSWNWLQDRSDSGKADDQKKRLYACRCQNREAAGREHHQSQTGAASGATFV